MPFFKIIETQNISRVFQYVSDSFDDFELWDRFWTLLDGPWTPWIDIKSPKKNSKNRFFDHFFHS